MTVFDRKKTLFKFLFIILIIACAGGYGYSKMDNVISGPIITVSEPAGGEITGKGVVAVKGNAKNISSITLDDRPIFVDENGNFAEAVALSSGYNILSLKGEDRFGKKTEKTIELVLKD